MIWRLVQIESDHLRLSSWAWPNKCSKIRPTGFADRSQYILSCAKFSYRLIVRSCSKASSNWKNKVIGRLCCAINKPSSEKSGVSGEWLDWILWSSSRKNPNRSCLNVAGSSRESAISSADRAKLYIVSMGALKCLGSIIEAMGKFS